MCLLVHSKLAWCHVPGHTSPTMEQYLYIYDRVGRGPNRSERTLVDTVRMRLRLGYRYYWECPWSKREYSIAEKECRVCGRPGLHTLRHYVMECKETACYRNASLTNVKEQIVWLLNNGVVEKILHKFPNFAPRM